MNAPWLAHHFTLPAPAGRKHCAEPGCERTLNTRDRHARCQKCRKAGNYLREKYEAVCPSCGTVFVKACKGTRACSRSCGQRARQRKGKVTQ